MAIAAPAPSPSVDPLRDPVTIREALALFDQTGYSVKESNLRRWARQDRLQSERSRGTTCYSWTALLVLHRERVVKPARRAARGE